MAMHRFKPHQVRASDELAQDLSESQFAALMGAPRSGKTRAAIRTIALTPYVSPLVLTKKNAIPGWLSEIDEVDPEESWTVTNYEQAHKLDPDDFDVVVLDESHNLGNRGKPTKRFKAIQALAWHKPLLIMSGTMVVETPLQIYYQTAISKYGPFSRFKSFYKFFEEYGKPDVMWLNGRAIEQYRTAKPELLDAIGRFLTVMSQEDAGITVKAVDRIHVVELSDITVNTINALRDGQAVCFDGEVIIPESDMAERLLVHQIEYGGFKWGEDYIDCESDEVADYIKSTFGDDENLAIMCHYISTRRVMERVFKKAHLYSSTAHAEGVTLAHYENFVIAGTCFSGAKHAQRRERGILMGRQDDSEVHFILTDKGVSRDVYNAVSKKQDWNLSRYRAWRSGRQPHQPLI